jgi:hypothetical protein
MLLVICQAKLLGKVGFQHFSRPLVFAIHTMCALCRIQYEPHSTCSATYEIAKVASDLLAGGLVEIVTTDCALLHIV